jgi:hypothetical protein
MLMPQRYSFYIFNSSQPLVGYDQGYEQGVMVARRPQLWPIDHKGVLTLMDLRVKNQGWHVPHHFLQNLLEDRRKIRNE